MKTKVSLLLISWFISFGHYPGHAQSHNFGYKRKLEGISNTWHKFVLEDNLFINSTPDLSDLRVLGINKNNDTLEVPYILKILSDKTSKNEISFKLINQTVNAGGKYYTFEVPGLEEINQITLDFEQENFDWKVTLEGSQNLNDWYGILQDYRILSIKNAVTDYTFTKLTFPVAKFKYFRLLIKEEKKPGLLKTTLVKKETEPGEYRSYTIKSLNKSENETYKQTIVDIRLAHYVPVSLIKLNIDKNFDFYRPVKVLCLVDSIKGPDGWNYSYQNVYQGVLSSLENNKIVLNHAKGAIFRIVIDNQNNTPLTINSAEVQGNLHELTCRFLEPAATYYLFYGDKNLSAPDYDISYFRDKIPADISTLKVGPEELIPQNPKPASQPLFANKMWLWGLMLFIIGLLGWFSIKMIKN